MERLGDGAFGAVENTLIPDAAGNRGTVDERFMQAGRINKAQGAYDIAVKLEKDQYDGAARAADLQMKAQRPWLETEKIRTKDETAEECARAAQARIDFALTKLGLETKPIASEGKMWIVTNEADGRGSFVKSLKPLLDPDNPQNQLDDPKLIGYETQKTIAAENNRARQTIASGRNATTIDVVNIRAGATKYSVDSNAQIKREQLGAQLRNQLATRKITIAGLKAKLDTPVSEGKLTQAQADAAYADATSATVVSNSGQAAGTVESIRQLGKENG